jgi:hypothetical protein
LCLSVPAAQGKMEVMRSVAAACAVLLALTIPIWAANAPVKTGKIFVGSFGMGDDGEQLRLALGYELGRAGFKVVDFEPQADSTLSGLIVTRVEAGRPVKRVTVFLKDKAGNQLWNQDIGSTASAASEADGIRRRAQDIAGMLKKDAAPAPKKAAKH